MKLFEIQRERKPKRRSQQTQFDDPAAAPDMSAFQRDMDSHARGTQNVPQKKTRGQLTQKQATAMQTHQAAANVNLPAEAGEKLSFLQSLGLQDIISDEQARELAQRQDTQLAQRDDDEDEVMGFEPVEPTTDNLPAIINKQVAAHDEVDPNWHQVKNLPGYIQNAIRALGRQVFGTFTKTPIEDIQVIANLGGQGPNTTREVNAIAGWLNKNGERDTDGEINFEKSIPDYGADFKIYSAEGFTFLVVKDEYGDYVYSWPTSDNIQDNTQIGSSANKRLK